MLSSDHDLLQITFNLCQRICRCDMLCKSRIMCVDPTLQTSTIGRKSCVRQIPASKHDLDSADHVHQGHIMYTTNDLDDELGDLSCPICEIFPPFMTCWQGKLKWERWERLSR